MFERQDPGKENLPFEHDGHPHTLVVQVSLWTALIGSGICATLEGMVKTRHRWNPRCDPPPRLVRPMPVDPSGRDGPTRGQAAGPRWRHTSKGMYVPADVDASVPEQRILEKSMLLPAGGAVTAWASLRLGRGTFFDGLRADGLTELPVPLITGRGQSRRHRDGITWLADRLETGECRRRYDIICTIEERALFDEMRRAPGTRDAVVAMDMGAAAEFTTIARMARYVEDRPTWLGVPQVRAALDLADENSRSPNETRMRLIWQIDARFPRPLVNQPVWDLSGKLLGIADILDPDAGVVGEFDGADHRWARRHSKDVAREGAFRDRDLEFFRVTGPDLLTPPAVVARMRSTRARAKWLPEGQRRWTIVPRRGWDDSKTLDQILDERDLMRELHEQWEREARGA